MKNTLKFFPKVSNPRGSRRRKKQSSFLAVLYGCLGSLIAWLRSQQLSRPERQLHIRETVSLGEKRFAAVLEYDGQRFLLGGAAQSVSLLTKLNAPTFPRALTAQDTAAEVGE